MRLVNTNRPTRRSQLAIKKLDASQDAGTVKQWPAFVLAGDVDLNGDITPTWITQSGVFARLLRNFKKSLGSPELERGCFVALFRKRCSLLTIRGIGIRFSME